jgi:hypothetical protein
MSKIRQISLATFILLWILSATYFTQPTFIDELDNIISGNQIRHGRVPYKDFFSQHTPIAYYVSALAHLVGANTLFEQRIFFYFLFALFFALLSLRHAKMFGNYLIPLSGLLLLSSHAANPVMAYTILSDQYQALCYVAVFLELLRLAVLRRSDTKAWVILSLSSFIAIGVTPISVFYLFISIFFYFVLNAKFVWDQKFSTKHNLSTIFRKTFGGIFILSMPFFVYIIYLLASNSLNDFYEQVYLVNRNVYSNYIGGLGSSILDPFKQAIPQFFNSFSSMFMSLREPTMQNLRYFLNFAGIFLFVALVISRNFLFSIIVMIVFSFSISRGIFGFHSQPFWALAAIALSFVLVGKLDLIRFSSAKLNYLDLVRKILGLPLLAIALFYFVSLSVSTFSQGLPKGLDRPVTNMEKVIYALVPKDGSYGNSSINVYEYVSTDRLPANGITGLVPWMVQDRQNIFIDEIKISSPELIFYNPLNEVWGYKLIDYAPLIHNFVEENYKKVPVSPGLFEGQYVYLKSSTYSKNLSKLRMNIPDIFKYREIYSNMSTDFLPLGEIVDGTVIQQKFSMNSHGFSQLKIFAATYARENSCTLIVSLYVEPAELVQKVIRPCQSIIDNAYLTLSFPPISDSADKKFVLNIESKGASPGNAVTVWTGSSSGLNNGKLFVNTERNLNDVVLVLSVIN